MKNIILVFTCAVLLAGCAHTNQRGDHVSFAEITAECGTKPVNLKGDAIRFTRYAKWKTCERELKSKSDLAANATSI